jgi:hypothetical protein
MALSIHASKTRVITFALALYRADDWPLDRPVMPWWRFPMTVLVLATDIGLVNLDNAAKFLLRLYHRDADFVAHAVRGLIGAEAHLPLTLERANSFLASPYG